MGNVDKIISDICEITQPEKPKAKTKTKEYYASYYHQTKEKVLCSCGKMVNPRNRTSHLKSLSHKKETKDENYNELFKELQELKNKIKNI